MNSQSPPPVWYFLLQASVSPQTASGTGDQVCKYVSLWGTFLIQITTLGHLTVYFLKDAPRVSSKILSVAAKVGGAGTWAAEGEGSILLSFSDCQDSSAWPWVCVPGIAMRAGCPMAACAYTSPCPCFWGSSGWGGMTEPRPNATLSQEVPGSLLLYKLVLINTSQELACSLEG